MNNKKLIFLFIASLAFQILLTPVRMFGSLPVAACVAAGAFP
jgi:hypothetical protein